MTLNRHRRILSGVSISLLMIALAACGSSSGSSTSTAPTVASSSASALTVPGTESGCPSAACSGVLAYVAKAASLKTLPANLTPTLQEAGSDLNMPAGYTGCEGFYSVSQTPACIIGSPQAATRIALFGDSHARMWSTAVAAIAARTGASLLFVIRSGCPVSTFAFANEGTVPPATCSAWINDSIRRIAAFNPTMVIVTSDAIPGSMRTLDGATVSQSKYESGLYPILKQIAAPSRRLVILGDIPYLMQDGPDCLAAHESDIQACSAPTSVAVHATQDLWQKDAGTKAGAQYVDVVPWLCTKSICPAVIGHLDVYENLYHITATYALYLNSVLQQALGLNSATSG
jgi:hypothetical protein